MSKKIQTLSQDIYTVLDAQLDHEPNADLAASYAMRIGGEMAKSTLRRDKPRVEGKLWASDLGKPCLRQHWYKFNKPELEAPLQGHTKFKFLYGNILEEAVLYLAEEAGHEVAYQQARVEWQLPNSDWMVSGRIDAVIDGVVVDVKSTSSYGYKKYSKEGIHKGNDSFGYIEQLGFYRTLGSFETQWDDDGGFVFIDKQNGHLEYISSPAVSEADLQGKAENIIDAVSAGDSSLVARGYTDEPYGQSGNRVLPISCSYCPFKKDCWKDSNGGRGLRTFLYRQGPVNFTEVKLEPRVDEIKDNE